MIYCIYVYCIYTNRCMLSISRFGVPHEFFCYPYHLSGDDIDIYRLLLPNLCFFLNMEKIHDISKKTPQNIVWPIKNPLKQFGHLSIMTPNDLRGSHNSNNNESQSDPPLEVIVLDLFQVLPVRWQAKLPVDRFTS